MTDIWNAKADALKTGVIAQLAEHGVSTVDDGALYEYLISASSGLLATSLGGDWAAMPSNELDTVITVLLNRLQPGDGIELREVNGVPVWLRAVPAVDGRLPPKKERGAWRWIRLDTITEVEPQVAIGVGDNPEDWQSILAVRTATGSFYASAMRFRGSAVNTPTDKLLRLIGEYIATGLRAVKY